MDAAVIWNATCPLSDPIADAEIVAKSLYDSMELQMAGDLQTVFVYELCGDAVLSVPYPPIARRLQSGGSEIKFKAIVTDTCSACDNQLYQRTDAALDTVVADGSLNSSIQNNSNGTMTASIGSVVGTSYTPMTNPPSKAPTHAPTTGSKSAKNAKTSGAPSIVGSKSVKSDKNSKKS